MFQVKFLLLAFVAALATAEYKIESRIIQGRDAIRGQFPFYAYLELSTSRGDSICGGSLISDQYVLTAAHCLADTTKAIVYLGSLRAYDRDEVGRKAYWVDSKSMTIHPRYGTFPLSRNDIGLIRLPEPVEFSDVIKPIPFACSSSSNSGVDVIAIGNGVTRDRGRDADILQYTELKTISKLSCLKSFPFLLFNRSVVCVKGEEKRSVCNGDSGGPLITSDNSLLGSTSFGSPWGCEVGGVQVFMRISKYASWIKEVSGVECKN